jgi:phage shock protein PspC (stress-responsive transcriptional regulator)
MRIAVRLVTNDGTLTPSEVRSIVAGERCERRREVGMRRPRRSWVRVIVVWTVLMLLVAIVVAAQAAWSITEAQQKCVFNFPAIPCPDGSDPAVARITFAFLGVPVAWLIGLGVVAVWWLRAGRRNGHPDQDSGG